MRTEFQTNPVSVVRITVGGCTDCEEEEREKRLEEVRQQEEFRLQDRVSLSAEAIASGSSTESPDATGEAEAGSEEDTEASGRIGHTDSTGRPLTDEEIRQVQELQSRDREVRAHEAAHKAAAGQHSRGGPTFEFETGPDGRRYAVSGEVQIDTSPVPDNPEATIRKAQTIRRAALAPADPSPQDRRVAAAASALENRARQQIQEERREDSQGSGENSSGEAVEPTGGTGETSSGESSTDSDSSRNNFERRVIRGFQRQDVPEPGGILSLFS